MKKHRGLFITFEGGEGGGKSTQIRELVKWLKTRRRGVLLTLEPGGSEIGKKIRQVLLDPKIRHLDTRAELLLYEADRAQHVSEIVFPALRAGYIVISDRYADSSTVYQGMCRKLGVRWTERLNHFATQGLMPDLAIVLDVSEKIGLARVQKRIREDVKLKGVRRAVKLDRLEREKQDFHRRVRRGFLALARRHPNRVKVIDASRTPDEVTESVRKLVERKLKSR
jgi:dTMP kinase